MKTKTIITALLLCVTIGVLADEQKALLEGVIVDYGKYQDKHEYSYDINGILSSEIYTSNEYGKWEARDKKEYSYNTMGKVETCILFFWERDENDWEINRKSEYSYNDKGDQIECKISMWDPDDEMWISSQHLKTAYTYDEKNRITVSIDSFMLYNMWFAEHKYTYTYDVAGYLLEKVTYFSNGDPGGWNTEGKSTYTYDSNGNLITVHEYSWKDASNTWGDKSENELVYDVNGYLITEILYKWIDNSKKQYSTSSYYYHGYNTALEQVETSVNVKGTKLLRNGQMYILREGKTYSVTGQEVR